MRQVCTIETVEERTLMSAAIMSQHPMLVMPLADRLAQNQGASQNPAPTAPTGLNASPSGATSVTLTWNALPANVDTVVVDYSTDGENFVTLGMLNGGDTSFEATGLSAGQTYSFKLWAMNADGTSPASSTVIASL